MQESTPAVISIINFLHGGQGHVLDYHLAVRRSANLNGWQHFAAYSVNENLDDVPQGWCNCLNGEFLETGIYNVIKNCSYLKGVRGLLSYGASIYRALKKLRTSRSIVFMESFNSLQLLSLLVAMFFINRGRLHLWLMYRNKPQVYGRAERLIFKISNALFGILFKDRFRILTDSDLLQASLSGYFNHSVAVMPIPHTHEQLQHARQTNHNEIVCWWAGSPRHCKGWDVIKRIAESGESVANRVTLVAASGAELQSLPGGVKLLSVNDILDRNDYINQLLASDICLLPYDPSIYGESTSGIFVECIVAGKIPIVSRATWMSYELAKFRLEELVADWQRPDIVAWLLSVAQMAEVKAKLALMQKAYEKYHNESCYAESMKALLQTEKPFSSSLASP